MAIVMSKKSDSHTSTILRVWPIILFMFYAWYFIAAAILAAGFKSFDMSYVQRIPFDWQTFDPTGSDAARSCWAAMVLSVACMVIAVFFVGKSTRMAWDYAISTYIVHWAITCIVTNAFPTSWIWCHTRILHFYFALHSHKPLRWVTIIVCSVFAWVCSELCCYRLRDLRAIAPE